MPRVTSHNAEKTHTCRVGCRSSFVRRTDRDRHEKIHRLYEEREYACSVEGCKFRANQSSGLKCHISSIHDKARILCPFPGCNEHYSDPSSLTRHKKKHHAGICPPDRPKRIIDLSASSSSSHRTTTISSSKALHHSMGCCAHVKLEGASSSSLDLNVLHTKPSELKNNFSSLYFPDASTQALTSDLENQLLNAMPDLTMRDIPTVLHSNQSSNHFMSDGGMNHPTSSSTNDLLLCKSVFDTNPSMSQYRDAAIYNTIPQTSYSISNASYPSSVMGSTVPQRAINAGSIGTSFANVQPSYDATPLPNYGASFTCMGPSTGVSQRQHPSQVNIPSHNFNYSTYNRWHTDPRFNTEGVFPL